MFMAAQPLLRITTDPNVALNNLKMLAKAKVPVVIQSVLENIAMDVMGAREHRRLTDHPSISTVPMARPTNTSCWLVPVAKTLTFRRVVLSPVVHRYGSGTIMVGLVRPFTALPQKTRSVCRAASNPSRSAARFQVKQGLFAGQAAGISSQTAITAD